MKRKKVRSLLDSFLACRAMGKYELTIQISLWIFPEGTRHLSASNDLLSFKKGAFYLAVQCKLAFPLIIVMTNRVQLTQHSWRADRACCLRKLPPPVRRQDEVQIRHSQDQR
jgi:1-acyl-sn-glycerol-3-phosphate acyltransferase